MHEAGHVGRDDIVGASFTHEFDFVVSHLGSHCLLRDGERSTKAAAFVRPFEVDELNTGDALQQLFRLRELGVVYALAHRSQADTADCGTAGVQSYFVFELRPGELTHLQDVVQKFHEVVYAGGNLSALRRIGRSCKFVPQMMGTTAGGSHDVIERGKVLDEEFFGCLRLLITSAIGHRLTTACLVEGVDDIDFQFLQKLQSGDTNLRIEKVDITGNHQGDLHGFSGEGSSYCFIGHLNLFCLGSNFANT